MYVILTKFCLHIPGKYTHLNTVEATHDTPILLINVRRGMSEFTLLFRPGAPIPLEFSTHL